MGGQEILQPGLTVVDAAEKVAERVYDTLNR